MVMFEFLKKNKVIVMCALLTVLLLLVPFANWLNIFVFAGIFLCSVFFSVQNSLCLFAYLFFFTLLLGFEAGTHVAWCLVLLGIIIKYVYGVIKKQEKIAKWPLIVSLVFYLFSIIPFWNYAHFFGIAMPLMFLVPIYLIYIYHNRIDVITLTKYLFGGLIASAVLSYLFCCICKISTYNIVHYAERMRYFTDHPNSVGFACGFIIAGLIVGIFTRRINWWTGIFMVSLTLFCGADSGSKSFFITLIVVLGLAVLILLMRNKKVAFITIGSLAIILVVSFFAFRSYFDYIFNRLFQSGDFSFNSITTGRLDVWKYFMREQFSDAKNVIFGMGSWAEIFLPYSVDTMRGIHSIYLEFFYYFGIIGVINLGLLIYSYIYTSRKEYGKTRAFLKLYHLLPIIVVALHGMVEMVIFNRKSMFLIIGLLFVLNGLRLVEEKSDVHNRYSSYKIMRQSKKHLRRTQNEK